MYSLQFEKIAMKSIFEQIETISSVLFSFPLFPFHLDGENVEPLVVRARTNNIFIKDFHNWDLPVRPKTRL